jgi:hypothetical protein
MFKPGWHTRRLQKQSGPENADRNDGLDCSVGRTRLSIPSMGTGTRKAALRGILAILAVASIAACANMNPWREPDKVDPNLFPADYKADLIDAKISR